MIYGRLLGNVSPVVFSPETGAGAGGGAPAGGSGSSGGGGQRDSGAGGAGQAGASAAGDVGAGAGAGGGAVAGSGGAADGGKAAPDKTAAATIAAGAGEAAPKAAAAAAGQFPEDWRQQFAGDNKADLKQLERLASPKAAWEAYRALQAKVSSGELKPVKEAPGANAKPEEIAAWRKEQGLPETPAAYAKDMKLADGLVLPDTDKPFVESFAQAAHEVGVPQKAFDRMVGWFYNTMDSQNAAREQADADFHVQSLAELRHEWGVETKPNQMAIANLIEMMPGGLSPEGAGTALLLARLPNGNLVGDDPATLRGLVAWAREQFPAATIVPAGTANPGAFIGGRIGELEKMMGDPRSAYNYGPQKAALQQEYRDLVDAQIRMKGKAA